jgi:uridine kinase
VTRGTRFELLVDHVQGLLAKGTPVVVAIAGFGGSGKTTLADRLAERFEVDRRQVVRTDNLYSTMPRGRGTFDITDWPLLIRLLSEARSADRLTYVGRDYDGAPVAVDEPMPTVLIVEGLRLLRVDVLPLYDVAVWIDCALDDATRRAKARNLAQGDSEYELDLWDTLWAPLDAEYFVRYEPHQLATFVYAAEP